MAEHTHRQEPGTLAAEPAGITEAIRLVVAALVAVGVFEVDDTTLNAVMLAIGGLVSIGLTFFTRRKSTPLAKPRTDDGRPLVPAPTRRPGNDPASGTPPPGPVPPTA